MLTDIKLPRLDGVTQLVDSRGVATATFAIWWDKVATQLETGINGINEALEAAGLAQTAAVAAQTAADTAQAAAATAQAAADNAQGDATDASSATALANSYPTGLSISASDAGASITLTISAHNRVYATDPQTTVAVNGGSIPGLAYNTVYYIHYLDPTRAGGTVTFLASTVSTDAAQINDNHSVGMVTTPAPLGSSSGRPTGPPGSYYLP